MKLYPLRQVVIGTSFQPDPPNSVGSAVTGGGRNCGLPLTFQTVSVSSLINGMTERKPAFKFYNFNDLEKANRAVPLD